MSIRVMADVYDFGPDAATDCSVLAVLASHANDDGESCYPKMQRIARMVRLSERSVIRAVARLEKAGWVTVRRGNGRGVPSQYTIQVERLKGSQPVTLSTEKGCHVVTLFAAEGETKRVTSTTEKGDIHDNPPAPPIRKKRQETSIKNLSRAAENAAREGDEIGTGDADPSEPEPDPRHGALRQAIQAMQRAAVGSEIWDGHCASALARMLKSRGAGAWPLERLLECAGNRFASDVNHAMTPAVWLARLTDYANGPLDRYGKPLAQRVRDAGVGAARPSKPLRNFDADLAALQAEMLGIGGFIPTPGAQGEFTQKLSERIDKGIWDTWLRPLRILCQRPDGVTILAAPSNAWGDVAKRFGDALRRAIGADFEIWIWDETADGNPWVPI